MSFRPAARQFFERRGAPTPPLPYDYAVEYIETDGLGAYINTGVMPVHGSAGSVIHATVQSITVNVTNLTNLTKNPLFGAASSAALTSMNYGLIAQPGTNNAFKTAFPSITSGMQFPQYDTNVHEVIIQDGLLVFDGVRYTLNSVLESRETGFFCLGSRGAIETVSNSIEGYTNTRFYSCKIYTNNILVFDGIPVRKDGEGYMYDLVSGNCFGNAGASGTTISIGTDKS